MTRTYSGGVRDPSDPKHYPTLVGTEGAVGASAAKRTLSTPGSFKETLLVRHDPQASNRHATPTWGFAINLTHRTAEDNFEDGR